MKGTKDLLLTELKRNGGHTVAELAEALGVANTTVRQHLTHLERDGLVAAATSRSNGRQHYVFRLTPKAHAAAFPRRSDRLMEILIREVGALDGAQIDGLTPKQRMSMLVERLAQRLADEYASLLQGWPLQERVIFVTEVLHADGGFAEWEQTERGYEIRDFNCLFHRLLDGEDENRTCEWHRSFLTRMLGASVTISPCPDSQSHCCRYQVEASQPAAGE